MNPKEFYEKVLKVMNKTELKDEDLDNLFGNIFEEFSGVVGSAVLGALMEQGKLCFKRMDSKWISNAVDMAVKENFSLVEKGFEQLQEWKKYQEEHAEEFKKMEEELNGENT